MTAALPVAGRLLALDVGTKRIGVAVSDPAQSVATPVATLTRRVGKRFPLQAFREYIARYSPVGIVVGLPLSSEGDETAWTAEVRRTGELIAAKTALPISWWDERMTSARVLTTARDMGRGTRGDKGAVDELAAAVLLQAFLDSRR